MPCNCKCPTHTFFWFTVVKMCFGIICFGLFTSNFHDDIDKYYVRSTGIYKHKSDNNYIIERSDSKFCGSYSAISICNIRRQVTVVACVAFPFAIEPAFIVAYLVERPRRPEITLAWLFSGVGFLTYIIGGSSILYSAIYYAAESKASATITGLIFILTAVAYIYHLAFMVHKFRRANANISNRVPPVPNAPPRELLYSEVLTPIIVKKT